MVGDEHTGARAFADALTEITEHQFQQLPIQPGLDGAQSPDRSDLSYLLDGDPEAVLELAAVGASHCSSSLRRCARLASSARHDSDDARPVDLAQK